VRAFLADEIGPSAGVFAGEQIPASTLERESLIFVSPNAAQVSGRVQFSWDDGHYEADRAVIDACTEPA